MISAEELKKRIKNQWLLALIVSILIFMYFTCVNYYYYKSAESNSFYTKEIDIWIQSPNTKDLAAVVEDRVRSKEFADIAYKEEDYKVKDEILEGLVFGQTYLDDEGITEYKVKLLVSSKDPEELEGFADALENSGKALLEERFDSEISFESEESTRIVAGKNANMNLASPYDEYRDAHRLSARNVFVYLISALLLGFATEVLWILFKDSLLRNKD